MRSNEPLALRGGHRLRVADAGNVAVGMEHDRGRHDRSGQAAAPDFVHARHVAEPDAPERVLERAHGGNAGHKAGSGLTAYWLFALVFHARRLALEVAQVVQLGAPHLGRSHDLDLLDGRRVQREDALDALAERHLAHRERRARAAAVQADHDALEDLDAFLVALAHPHVHADRVARLHRRPLGQLRLLDDFNGTHVCSSI